MLQVKLLKNLNKSLKLTILTVLAVLISVAYSGNILALSSTSSATSSATLAQRMTNLKSRADTEIQKRISALSVLNSKISANKKLTAVQKSAFTTAINGEISNLTTLKTKIDADTDLTTLKADVQSIVQSYRVYMVYMPQIHIMAASDAITTASINLLVLEAKLQVRITAAQKAGKDITALQTQLADMKAKLADANIQATNAYNLVSPLTPGGYPGNITQLQAGRADIKNGSSDLKAAWTDAKNIIATLKSLQASKTSTSSASSSQ